MKKRIVFLALSTIFIIFLFSLEMQFDTPPEKMLKEAFLDSGARIVSSEVYFDGKLEDGRLVTTDELESMARDIAVTLGAAVDSSSLRIVDNENMAGIEMNCALSLTRNLDVNAAREKNSRETAGYITASITDTSPNPDLAETRQSVGVLFEKYGIKAGANTCITGSFQGRLSEEEMDRICARVLEKADAKKVEGIKENTLTSISAYSPYMEDSVRVKGGRVNMNLAVRYNSYEDKTYIWLATPVITTEY